MGASICCAAADAGTQFTIFAWCALKKQCPISRSEKAMSYLYLFISRTTKREHEGRTSGIIFYQSAKQEGGLDD